MNQIEFKTDGTKNMKNKKGFLQGALCGALAMLLAAGLVSCGLKVKNSNSGEKDTTEAISSETDKSWKTGIFDNPVLSERCRSR